MNISIAHISDLHLSSEKALEIFELVATDIQSVKSLPVLIIVTGDIVDHPDEDMLRRARERLRKLCEACAIDPDKRLIVIPGNHDYRHFGVWNRESVNGSTFNKIFPHWQLPRFIDLGGRCIALFCFDSNTNDPRINLARGRVGQKEYGRFQREYEKLRNDNKSAFEESFKIALLHHHPLPIAETEIDKLTENDAFLALEDAGTFMTEMVNKKIDLVLHGHKHCPFFARIKFVTTRYVESELTVLAAGSASKPNSSKFGNAYNLIRVTAETIEVEQRYRDTPQGTFKERYPDPIPILGYEGFRERSYEIALRNAAFSVESETHNLLINEFGDSKCTEEFRNLRVGDGKRLEGFPKNTKTTAGTLKGLRAFSRTSTMRDPEWQPDGASTDKLYKGEVRFSRPIVSETGPVSFDTSYNHFNAFALTKEQGKRMYGDDEPEFYKFFVKYPIGTLFNTINFPSDIRTSSFEVFVRNEHGEHNVLEETHCRQYLHVSELTRSAILVIPKPLQTHEYGISWQLQPEVKNLSTRAEGRAKLIRKQLLNVNLSPHPSSISDHPLQKVFGDIRQELLARYPSRDVSAYFDVGLMVYDEEIKKLRHVAGVIQEQYWSYQLHEGEGAAGRAHKLNSAHLYVRSVVKAEMAWYASPPESLSPHEVAFAVPLRYPVPLGEPIGATQGSVIGVLWVGSTSPDSGLLDLYERREEGDELISRFHEDYFLRRILPAIGLPEMS